MRPTRQKGLESKGELLQPDPLRRVLNPLQTPQLSTAGIRFNTSSQALAIPQIDFLCLTKEANISLKEKKTGNER